MPQLLKIDIPTSTLVIPAVNAGPLLASLESAYCVRSEGYGSNEKWKKAEETVSISFISDTQLQDKPEPLENALKAYEDSQTSWLNEYHRRTKAETLVKELEAKLEAVQAASSNS